MPTDGAVEVVPDGRNIDEGVKAVDLWLGVQGFIVLGALGLGVHELGLGLRAQELR